MIQKNCKPYKKQTLSNLNLRAAQGIYHELKAKKVLSAESFRNTFFSYRNGLPSYGGHQNWKTTLKFLKDHNLLTTDTFNGFRFYYATQKCARCKSFTSATA